MKPERELPPWVKRVIKPVPCQGWVAKRASLRRMYSDDPDKRVENARRTACKRMGHWRFRALSKIKAEGWAPQSGIYCWSHLVHQGLYGSMREWNRTEKWAKEKREGKA